MGKGEKEIASERTRSVFTASRCDWPPLTSAHYGSSFFRYRRGPRDPLLAPFRMYTLLPMNIKAARTLALLATLPLPEHNRAGAYSVALEPRLSGTRVSHSLSHLRYAFTLLFFSSLKQVLVFLSLLSLNRSSFSLACTLVVILLFLFVFLWQWLHWLASSSRGLPSSSTSSSSIWAFEKKRKNFYFKDLRKYLFYF